MLSSQKSLKKILVSACMLLCIVSILLFSVLLFFGYHREQERVDALAASSEHTLRQYLTNETSKYKDALSLLGYSSLTQTYLFSSGSSYEYMDMSYILSSLNYVRNSIDHCSEVFLQSNMGKVLGTASSLSSDSAEMMLFKQMSKDYRLYDEKPYDSFFSKPYYITGCDLPYIFYVQRMTNIISTESDKYITCAIMLDYQAWINALQVSLNEENGYYVILTDDRLFYADSAGLEGLTSQMLRTAGQRISVQNTAYRVDRLNSPNDSWNAWYFYPVSKITGSVFSSMQFELYVVIFLFITILTTYLLLSLVLKRLTLFLKEKMVDLHPEGKLEMNGLFAYEEFMPILITINEMLEHISSITQKEMETQIKLYQTIAEQKIAELRSLRMQLNAHFLFNTLSAVNSIALSHEDHEVSDIVLRLGNIFHYILFTPAVTELSDELDMVTNFAEIMEQRFPAFHELILDITPEALDWQVPTMFLQPLVENSFEHGHKMPAEKSRTATTRITAFIEQDTLILRIWDNGCGIPACRLEQILSNIQLPKDPSDERDAITLKNICYRFSLIYAEQFHFSIRSEENVYTEVELQIPVMEPETLDRLARVQHIVI